MAAISKFKVIQGHLPFCNVDTPKYICMKLEWIPCSCGEANFCTRIRTADPEASILLLYTSQTHTGPYFLWDLTNLICVVKNIAKIEVNIPLLAP